MCGLAGILTRTAGLEAPERADLTRMIGVLAHRGPDEFGLYRDRHVGLVHARLSIVDLTSGQQPMSSGESGAWIVFNGEVFNFQELRRELELLGFSFATHSDTEVILQAWRAWGVQAFTKMNGQWSVAIWESSQRKLILARDPTGICPLHWTEFKGRLYFASEVKAIFAANPEIPRNFDPVGLDQLLTFWSTVAPQNTFEGIHELPPGHVRTYQDHQVEEVDLTPVWPHLSSDVFSGDLNAAVIAVEKALTKAVEMRIVRADVPVGSYLSGGLDSSIIAAFGQRFSKRKFQTFSLRFSDAEFDETSFQRELAQRIGSEHHEILVGRKDIADVFPRVIWHTERPILRTAPAPLFLLSSLVRSNGIKVVLTGEGADEMFGGYDLFREGKVRRFWARQPQSQWRPALLDRLYPYLSRSPAASKAHARQFFGRDLEHSDLPGFAHGTRWRTTAALKRLLHPQVRNAAQNADATKLLLAELPVYFPALKPLAQDQFLEVKTLLAGYLLSSQGDRVLLGNSVEGRFPFLDADVGALAHSLPEAYKLRVLDEKHVLKRLARDVIPERIIERKKQPYRAPDAMCFVGPDAPEYVAEILSERSLKECGVFDSKVVEQLYKKCLAQNGQAPLSNSDNMGLVAVISTQLLSRQFVVNVAAPTKRIDFKTDVDKLRN